MMGVTSSFDRDYCQKLMEAAVYEGKQAKWLPKWWYLLREIPGSLKWLMKFKTAGASAALEPVYANAPASSDLIPPEVKALFVQLSDEMNSFIRWTMLGEVYGERYRHIVAWVEDCRDDVDLVVSLGSGRGSPELVGLHRRQKAGRPMPKLLLVDSSKKALERARRYARVLGLAPELVETEVRRVVGYDYKCPSGARRVMVGSWGLSGNYFPDESLRCLMFGMKLSANVTSFSTDFVDPRLADALHNAIGWPVAVNDDDAVDFTKVKPRDLDYIKRIIDYTDWNCISTITPIARGQMNILEMARGLDPIE